MENSAEAGSGGSVFPGVNFVIAGGLKTGTTALNSFLIEHEDICLAKGEEPQVFTRLSADERPSVAEVNDLYRPHFLDYAGERLVGEKSPPYLHTHYAFAHMQRYNPQMKMIVLLRNPIKVALSNLWMCVANGVVTEPVDEALATVFAELEEIDELETVNHFSTFLTVPLYGRHVQNLLQFFSRQQVLLLDNEELFVRHEATLCQVYDFLGVQTPKYLPEHAVVKSRAWQAQPSLATLVRMREYFRADVELFAELTGVDFVRKWLGDVAFANLCDPPEVVVSGK